MNTAADIQWQFIERFSPGEWPGGVLEQMNPSIIYALSAARNDSGVPVMPSPVAGAHVRQHGTSRHSTMGGSRLSDATDVFVPGGWAQAVALWQAAQRVPEIGGIGIYANKRWVRPMPMLHLDTRKDRLLWVCRGNPDEYIYLPNNPALFFDTMAKGMED